MIKFAYDTKIDGTGNKKEDTLLLAFNLNNLVKLSESNKMQVEVTVLCKKEQGLYYQMRDTILESSKS